MLKLSNIHDIDAVKLFTYLDFKPSYSQRQRYARLISQLKTYNQWNKIDCLWCFATEEQQHANICIKNPQNKPLLPINSPAWEKFGGYIGNGSNAYLDTSWIPATNGVNFTQNSGTMGVYSHINIAANYCDMGCNESLSADRSAVYCQWSDNKQYGYINSSLGPSGNVLSSLGHFASVRTGASTTATYQNGTLTASGTEASTGLSNTKVYILAINNNGSAISHTTRQLSFAYIGSGDLDQTILTTIFNEYLNSIYTFDSDAVAYFNKFTKSCSFAQKIRYNNFISNMKNYGYFTEQDRIWLLAGENENHVKISLRNPNATAISAINSPTWTTGGYDFNGTSQYLDTITVMSTYTKYTRDAASAYVYIRENGQSAGVDFGATSNVGVNELILHTRKSDDLLYEAINDDNATNTVSNTDSRGFYQLRRNSGTNVDVFKNGSLLSNVTESSTGTPGIKLFIGAHNNNGITTNYCNRQLAAVMLGSSVPDPGKIYTDIVQAYMIELG